MLEFIFTAPGQHSLAQKQNLNYNFQVFKGIYESRKYFKTHYKTVDFSVLNAISKHHDTKQDQYWTGFMIAAAYFKFGKNLN